MSLLDQVKAAIRRGFTDEQIAGTLGVSAHLVGQVRRLLAKEEAP